MVRKVCEYCKEEFEAKTKRARFCGDTCKKRQQRAAKKEQREKLVCKVCGKEFDVQQGGRIYCSDECSEFARLQKQMLSDTKKRALYFDDYGDGY